MRSMKPLALAAAFAVVAAAGTASAATGPQGHWQAETIQGKRVAAKPASVLDLAEDGKVAGTGGCNRIIGKAKIEGAKIDFGALGGTMMMCEPGIMKQEQKFLTALGKARSWRLETSGKKLVLVDEAGKPVLVLKRK